MSSNKGSGSMTTPKRRKKHTGQKNRFQNAMGVMDRWSLPKFSPETPIKKYAMILLTSIVGGVLVFGGLSAMIDTNPNKELARDSHPLKKQASETKHSKHGETARLTVASTIETASSAHKSIELTGSAFVSGSNAAIRDRPAINAKIVERAVFGSNVELLSQEGKWVQVRSTGQNVSGWIEKAYLSF